MAKPPTTFKLGRYEVLGRIATGGMATVYRGRLPGKGGFSREFALKVVHPHLAQLPGFAERFLDEARVASRVRHPNCVATIDIDESKGYQFLVLDLIDGVTLRQLSLYRDRKLLPDEAARVVADAARGLHAVHQVVDDRGEQLDVIHRDLSPHNLMLDARGRTILIDLGLAKARGQLGHTQTGVLAGKLPYMSPEQSRLEPLDGRSDVFSLGTVLFELTTGTLPFGEDHTPGTLDRLRTCDREELAEQLMARRVPEWLAGIILSCLHAQREDRIASSLMLAEAIEQELHTNGREEVQIRRNLAIYAQEAKAAAGPDAAPEQLAPLIKGAEEAAERAEEQATEQVSRRPRVWPMLAGAAALVALVGVGTYLASGKQVANVEAAPAIGPSLAADTPQPELAPQPAKLRTPHPAAPPATVGDEAETESTGDSTGADELDPSLGEPESPRKRRTRKRRPKLKDNPYQE